MLKGKSGAFDSILGVSCWLVVAGAVLGAAAAAAGLGMAPAAGSGAYTQARIVAATDDAAVRGNAGNLTVRVQVSPPLQKGHRLQLLLDDVVQGAATSASSIELRNLDRGTHSLQVQVVDSSGSVLFAGARSTFHLLRHSRLHPVKATPQG